MRIGYINYLNCYPFYHHMLHKEAVPGVEIVPGYPAQLNGWMRDGSLDLSPVSAGAFPSLQEKVSILPQFCLSSIGYVRSVILRSNLPIEDLDGRSVGLTSASETSVALLKILLEKYYHLKPRYVPVAPNPDMKGVDAALVIGNDAMVEPPQIVPYIYDLGDLWMRKTGHPVVFAIFIVQNDFLAAHRSDYERVIESYKKSLGELRTNSNEVIECALRKYPNIPYDLQTYYDLLKFEFTDQFKDAVRFYYDEAAMLGVLPPVNRLSFVNE